MRTGRPIQLKGALGDAARMMGGVQRLAAALDVSEGTIRAWGRRDTLPTLVNFALIGLLARDRLVRK